MRKYSNENYGYNYILNVIDTFSEFVWSAPLKKKDGISVSKAFRVILENVKAYNHKTPDLLHTDKGLEFENKTFRNTLKEFNIKMYHTQSEEKSSIIERFNRTLNGKIKVNMEVGNHKIWIDTLQDSVEKYNYKDLHRSIEMTPAEVNEKNEDGRSENFVLEANETIQY